MNNKTEFGKQNVFTFSTLIDPPGTYEHYWRRQHIRWRKKYQMNIHRQVRGSCRSDTQTMYGLYINIMFSWRSYIAIFLKIMLWKHIFLYVGSSEMCLKMISSYHVHVRCIFYVFGREYIDINEGWLLLLL